MWRRLLPPILLCAACDAADALELGDGDGGAIAPDAATIEPRPDAGAAVDGGWAAGCEGDGDLDFSLSGAGLEAWEGRRLWAAALENGSGAAGQEVHHRVFALETRVDAGAFVSSCARVLDGRASYPSWALVIDANGDGRCSTGDRFVYETLFVWGHDLAGTILPSRWRELELDDAGIIPVGSDAADLCGAFFF